MQKVLKHTVKQLQKVNIPEIFCPFETRNKNEKK